MLTVLLTLMCLIYANYMQIEIYILVWMYIIIWFIYIKNLFI